MTCVLRSSGKFITGLHNVTDSEHFTFSADSDSSGKRLDQFLADKIPNHSRSAIQKLIKSGHATHNGIKSTSPRLKLKTGNHIELTIPKLPTDSIPLPEAIDLETIYEDDDIIVINKQPGIVVHPGAGTKSATIVNALMNRFENFADKFSDKSRPGIVHRLDKDTSGCLIIAKDQINLDKLISLFKRHKIKKTYLTLLAGHLKNSTGTIDSKIGRHPVNRKKMAILENSGKDAITHYRVLDRFIINNTPVSLVEVNIETGRTHQIRVHMASIHHPVLGDKTYGGHQKLAIGRQLLHAWKLTIIHPSTRKEMNFTAPLPEDMKEYSEILLKN